MDYTWKDYAAERPIDELVFWLERLTAREIVKVELHLRRLGLEERANIAEEAGLANCADEYYDL